MATLEEAARAGGQMAATLAEGLRELSLDTTLTFVQYSRQVLPLDGLVFWVAGIDTREVQGSLHYAFDTQQNEADTNAVTAVSFATPTRLDDLLEVNPQFKWIACYKGMRLAFTRQDPFYGPSDINHYVGRALLATELSQIVDSGHALDPTLLISSDSLPAFILLNSYAAPYPNPYNPGVLPPIYPSYLVPANAALPYAAVSIERSESAAPVPWQDANSNPNVLTYDSVKITMYGLDNNQAHLLRDAIVAFSQDQNVIGIADIGAIRSERDTQSDFLIVGQKKTLTLRVAYIQSAIIDFARAVFASVQTSYTPTNIL